LLESKIKFEHKNIRILLDKPFHEIVHEMEEIKKLAGERG
jgi:hypothetical protein